MPSSHSTANHMFQHFITALLVPVGILAEPHIESWFTEHKFGPSDWIRFAVIVGFYALAFVAIWCFNMLVERRQSRAEREEAAERARMQRIEGEKPIVIGDVGPVKEKWIDAIWSADGELKQGSIIEFKSSQAGGFVAEGETFDYQRASNGRPAQLSPQDPSDFKTITTMRIPDGFAYFYTGRELGDRPGGAPHQGVGFYEFRVSKETDDKLFRGAFLALEEEHVRHVRGRKLRGKEWTEFTTPEGKRRILLAYLCEQEQRGLARSP